MAGPNGKSSDAAPQSNGYMRALNTQTEKPWGSYNVLGLHFFFVTYTNGLCNHSIQIAPS